MAFLGVLPFLTPYRTSKQSISLILPLLGSPMVPVRGTIPRSPPKTTAGTRGRQGLWEVSLNVRADGIQNSSMAPTKFAPHMCQGTSRLSGKRISGTTCPSTRAASRPGKQARNVQGEPMLVRRLFHEYQMSNHLANMANPSMVIPKQRPKTALINGVDWPQGVAECPLSHAHCNTRQCWGQQKHGMRLRMFKTIY